MKATTKAALWSLGSSAAFWLLTHSVRRSKASALMNDPTAHVTKPEDARIDVSGWATVSTGSVTKLPLLDASTGGFAHLTPAGALAAASLLGAELATTADVDAIHAEGVYVPPFPLPTMAMLASAGIAANDTKRVNDWRNANMRTRAWCDLHDAHVRQALLSWDGTKPVDGAGKHWCAPDLITPKGFGLIYGWFTAPAPQTAKIQTPYRGHLDVYSDYATTAHLARH